MEKKLYRDEYRKKIAGVCAGIAEYMNIDVTVVRLVFVLMAIFHGSGGLVYIILWIVLPKRPYIFHDPTVDYTVPPQNPAGNPFGDNAFQGSPYPNPPVQPLQPQHNGTSLFAIIFGTVLIIVGGSILLDRFDIIPDWDFWHLWPIIPITVGCILILSGENEKKLKNAQWQDATDKKDNNNDNDKNEPNPPADNAPTV
ncbi:MAG: PspC domain-containing protein [Bacteroidetes bacterium]|nr:PspC domain-containing protein [Bacteroidota bacterium]